MSYNNNNLIDVEAVAAHLRANVEEENLKDVLIRKIEDLEKEAFEKDLDRFRELSELQKIIKKIQKKHQNEIEKLKEKLIFETETVITLKQDIESKNKNINELKTTIKEFLNCNNCLIRLI